MDILIFLFDYLSLGSATILLAAGLFFLKAFQGKIRLIIWIALASVLADVISLILFQFKINNWAIGNSFFIVQFVLLFIILSDQRRIILLRIVFYLCLLFIFINFFFIETQESFNTNTSYVVGIFMIVMALNYLYQLLSEMPVERIQSFPFLWLCFGVLIYYGGNLFLFLFNNYLMTHSPEIHQNTWVIHNSLNIIKNVFFFATLWVSYKHSPSPL